MLAQLISTLSGLLHLLSTIATLCGIAFLLASLLSMKGPDGYVKGILLCLLGRWMSHMVI